MASPNGKDQQASLFSSVDNALPNDLIGHFVEENAPYS